MNKLFVTYISSNISVFDEKTTNEFSKMASKLFAAWFPMQLYKETNLIGTLVRIVSIESLCSLGCHPVTDFEWLAITNIKHLHLMIIRNCYVKERYELVVLTNSFAALVLETTGIQGLFYTTFDRRVSRNNKVWHDMISYHKLNLQGNDKIWRSSFQVYGFLIRQHIHIEKTPTPPTALLFVDGICRRNFTK